MLRLENAETSRGCGSDLQSRRAATGKIATASRSDGDQGHSNQGHSIAESLIPRWPLRNTGRLVSRLRDAWDWRPGRPGRSANAQAAAAAIAALPTYQVALWPDGWLLEADGSVRVRDTHEMAEARRWLNMAARNTGGGERRMMADGDVARTMRLHGIFVPRAIIDMAGCRFATEQVASVALSLVAGDWISERRRALGRSPGRELALRAQAWTGSLHADAPDADASRRLLERLLGHCIDEGLVPRTQYQLSCRADEGYGIRCCRCFVQVDLGAGARARIQAELGTALISWNRAVICDGRVTPVLSVHVSARADRGGRARAPRALSDDKPVSGHRVADDQVDGGPW